MKTTTKKASEKGGAVLSADLLKTARAAFDLAARDGDICNGRELRPELAEVAAAAVLRGDVATVEDNDGTGPRSSYEIAARAVLVFSGCRFSARFLGFFDSAAEWGAEGTADGVRVRGCIPVWRVRITNKEGASLSVRFRGSIQNGRDDVERVSVYSVLACLQKSDPGSFDDFASEYGYFPIKSQADYKRARATWRACLREYAGVCRVWTDDGERLRLGEIA